MNEVYLVERKYYGVSAKNKDKFVSKSYSTRLTKEGEKRTEKKKGVERVAKIDLDALNWEEISEQKKDEAVPTNPEVTETKEQI